MGGTKLACGCFDGPLNSENPELVAIRCGEHIGVVEAPMGYRLLTLAHRPVHSAPARPRMAIPKTRRRRG